MRVLVFGASITQGFWDSQGGWVERLRQHYDELALKDLVNHSQPTIFNLGVSGDSTKDLLARLKNETKAREFLNEELAFVFSIGTNNAREENGKLYSSPESYRADLKELITQAKTFSNKIMFVGLPACDETRTTPVSWRYIDYRNENLRKLDQVMKGVCEEQALPYVPVFEKFINAPELLADGLHPNDAGHKLIVNLVKPELEKLLA